MEGWQETESAISSRSKHQSFVGVLREPLLIVGITLLQACGGAKDGCGKKSEFRLPVSLIHTKTLWYTHEVLKLSGQRLPYGMSIHKQTQVYRRQVDLQLLVCQTWRSCSSLISWGSH